MFMGFLFLFTIICLTLNDICDICMALGGLGTVATFLSMICDSKKKTRQINTIQTIQSNQLESLYEPDIRLESWTGSSGNKHNSKIVVKNYGYYLKVLDIKESTELGLIKQDGIAGWFPRDFEKTQSLHIPLSLDLNDIEEDAIIGIVCLNKLGLKYIVNIHIVKGRPSIDSPIKCGSRSDCIS